MTTVSERPRFAVVIPFYQDTPGILRRALHSVAAQDVDAEIRVYVVDDASPVAAHEELEGLAMPANVSVVLLRQENGGPGAARNTGLSHAVSADFIAFLDSDDEWYPHHLSAAAAAMAVGADYYTSDLEDLDGERYHRRFFSDLLPLSSVEGLPWAGWLTSPLVQFTIHRPISHLSALVVRRSLLGDARFDPTLRTAGEDAVFTTTLALRGPGVIVSRRVDVRRGRGINIFSVGGWGSAECFQRQKDYLRSRYMIRGLLGRRPSGRIGGIVKEAERGFVASALASYRRGGVGLMGFIAIFLRFPRVLAVAPGVLYKALTR